MVGYQLAPKNPTIECHCSEITVPIENNTVALQAWDTAGQETYRGFAPVYLRGARAAILVYDVTDPVSFELLGHWYGILHGVVPVGLTNFLVGNEIDLEDEAVVEDMQAQAFANTHNAQLFKVSAADGTGIDLLFEAIAQKRSSGAELEREPSDRLALGESSRNGCR
jgi:small GTP-binding protein